MEYEYLFTKSLHEQLKERIKGKIFCKVINNILIINIDTKEGIGYGCTIDGFAKKLQLSQISQESIVNDVLNEYKKKILNTFLY